jgi:hypothetical protein
MKVDAQDTNSDGVAVSGYQMEPILSRVFLFVLQNLYQGKTVVPSGMLKVNSTLIQPRDLMMRANFGQRL